MTITKEQVSTARLEEMLAGLEGVQGGPWKLDKFACYVWAPSEKGGDFPLMDELGEKGRVAELRGWGYYTGKGHGALGLDPDEAARRQRLTGEHVARLDPDTMRLILTEIIASRALRSSSEPVVKGLVWTKCAISQHKDLTVPYRHGLIVAYAETAFGTYGVVKGTQDRYEAWLGPHQVSGSYLSHDEAAIAAHRDLERRVLSAIVASPQEEPVENETTPFGHEYGEGPKLADMMAALDAKDASPQLSQPNTITSGVDGDASPVPADVDERRELIARLERLVKASDGSSAGTKQAMRDALAALRTPAAGEVSEIDAPPQTVISLVIAAREVMDRGFDHDDAEANALDKALEPFAALVPYENEPDAPPTLTAGVCQTCNGTGKEGPFSICRDCDGEAP